MESQHRKRLRGDGYSKNAGLSSGSSPSSLDDSNEDQKMMETMPELVSVIFLQYLRDVRILKACRLVSKSWNIYATESLRTCSKVCLREDNPGLKAFTKLLLQRAIDHFHDLPSPFQNFHVEAQFFIDPTFQTLISLPNISISSLSIILNTYKVRPNEPQLRLLLTANQTKIENLTITAYEDNDDGFLKCDGIKLMSLKSLQIEDHCREECTHVEFMKSFLRMCKPERLHLSFDDSDSMHSLLLEVNVDNLKQLLLDSELSMPSCEYLNTLRFSKLRKLTLLDRDFIWPYEFPHSDSIFQNISPLLEELVTTVPISISTEPKFRHLKILKISINTALSCLTSETFPSLEKVIVYCKDPIDDVLVENTSDPHLGVQSLEMMIDIAEFYNPPFHQELMVLLTSVSGQFPKVTSLTFTISKFDPTTLTVDKIFEAFPNLMELFLDGPCDFFYFSGMDTATIAEYVERGGSIETIPRRKSITDFMELETIVFGSSFIVDPDMVRYCLPRVPKLREISLHWNESLSAPLLRDSIGHLERITILNAAYGGFQDAMAQVAEMLPNAYRK